MKFKYIYTRLGVRVDGGCIRMFSCESADSSLFTIIDLKTIFDPNVFVSRSLYLYCF